MDQAIDFSPYLNLQLVLIANEAGLSLPILLEDNIT